MSDEGRYPLYLTESCGNYMRDIRTIRECLATLRGLDAGTLDGTLEDARMIVDEFNTMGIGFIGATDDELVAQALRQAAESVGVTIGIDSADELSVELDVDSDDPDSYSAVSRAGYYTALAVLAAAQGNPLVAGLHALSLARASQDVTTYSEAIAILLTQWPHIKTTLTESGYLEV